ncbi:hypothetical protein Hanom_Chr10g00946551 [Helianthus anomalus]
MVSHGIGAGKTLNLIVVSNVCSQTLCGLNLTAATLMLLNFLQPKPHCPLFRSLFILQFQSL